MSKINEKKKKQESIAFVTIKVKYLLNI